MKAISAQQEAAKTFIIRAIYRRTSNEGEQVRLLKLMQTNPTADNWLHCQFRLFYQRGHTFVRNQIVYQNNGYSCKRLTRNTVLLECAGLFKGKRISLKLKCRHLISGQIRLICNSSAQLEVHCTRSRALVTKGSPTSRLGIDKGYTEAFYTTNSDVIANGLGTLMTEKTKRITRTNRNRYRLRKHTLNNPTITETILKNNLGYLVKSSKLKKEKATIQNFIRRDLRRIIKAPTIVFAEDLASLIKSKQQAKAINRKLNQWMKGELQSSLEKIAVETGAKLTMVSPAYTSQMCSHTGTLLCQRVGDRFIRFTGDVVQADLNAALIVILLAIKNMQKSVSPQ